jgi:hypothetical protein
MKYYATWHSSTHDVRVVEVDDNGNEELLHEGGESDTQSAGDFVKEQGFGFMDLWTLQPDTYTYKAPLKAM